MIDELITQYGKRLYGLCITLCSHKFEADDLYQETWLKVFNKIDKYDKEKEFEPWLSRICINIWKDLLRRKKLGMVFDNFSSPEEKEAVMEKAAADEPKDYGELYDAIQTLPEKLRITVILFYFRDMDIKQTANVLKVPPGTVKSRLNKARNLLKDILEF